MGDKNKGLYTKFQVKRIDGTHRKGGKHENCDYFVLDLTHDAHALPALRAYQESARKDGYFEMANQLLSKIEAIESQQKH